jgi:hypothetical protein
MKNEFASSQLWCSIEARADLVWDVSKTYIDFFVALHDHDRRDDQFLGNYVKRIS